MKNKIQRPTEAELEILSVLWRFGPSTVRTVNECLNEKKDVGYTTTLKFMQIMMEKGLLSREEQGRLHVYSPVVREEEVQEKLVDRLLETAFGGSAKKLVMQALGNHDASADELREIKALIRKLEGGRS